MWIGNPLDPVSCLPVRPVPRKLGCNSSSLSHTHSLTPLNWSCVWIGSSVWQLCQPWWMQRKAMAFCQRDTTAPWWSWQGSSAVPAQKVTPWHICLLYWRCSCLLPFSRSFYRCGGSSWLPLLLTPSRSHQLLEALSSLMLPQCRNPFCPPHCRILLPTVQALELLSTRTAHFSNSALHDTAKASDKSLLISQKAVYHYSHSPQLFSLLVVLNPF